MLTLMFQTWSQLAFIHWRYSPAELGALLPPALKLDMFDGSGWVGITPFVLRGLRPRLLPPFPLISSFPETNCRTYVKGPDGRAGIWFFSLDAARMLAVVGARLSYGLPYAWSKMRVRARGNRITYESDRKWPDCDTRTNIEIEHTGRIQPQSLETFLTERYVMYSLRAGRLHYTEVEHAPWPLERAHALRLEQNVTKAAGLGLPDTSPTVHFSPGVRVRVGPPRAAVTSAA
jgi:uncharacterized protein